MEEVAVEVAAEAVALVVVEAPAFVAEAVGVADEARAAETDATEAGEAEDATETEKAEGSTEADEADGGTEADEAWAAAAEDAIVADEAEGSTEGDEAGGADGERGTEGDDAGAGEAEDDDPGAAEAEGDDPGAAEAEGDTEVEDVTEAKRGTEAEDGTEGDKAGAAQAEGGTEPDEAGAAEAEDGTDDDQARAAVFDEAGAGAAEADEAVGGEAEAVGAGAEADEAHEAVEEMAAEEEEVAAEEKTCRRYWNEGGFLCNVPVGGARRNRPSSSTLSCISTFASTSVASSREGAALKDLDLEAATFQVDIDRDVSTMWRILNSFVPGAALSRTQVRTLLFLISCLILCLGVIALCYGRPTGPVFGLYPAAYYIILAVILAPAVVGLVISCFLSCSDGRRSLVHLAKHLLPFAFVLFLLTLAVVAGFAIPPSVSKLVR
jgi:hypothetical protein